MTRERRTGILFIMLAVMGYSTFPVFTKLLLGEGMRPLDIGLWRFVFAVSILWIVRGSIAVREGGLRLPKLPPVPILIMGASMALAALSGFYGLERLPAPTYLVLFYTYPMMTALIEALFGKRLPAAGWAALALTLLGVVVAAPDFSKGLQGDNLPGVLIAFVNAFMVALYFLISSRVFRDTGDKLGSSALVLTATLATMSVIALAFGTQPPPTLTAWALVATMAVVGTIIPVFALNQGVPRLGAAQAGIIASIEPITGSLLAAIFVGEIMTESQWLGGLIIVAGIIVLQAPALIAARSQPKERVLESV